MINGIRQRTVVREGGKIEIISSELPTGKNVEVFVWVEPDDRCTTEYLLPDEANRKHFFDGPDPRRVSREYAEIICKGGGKFAEMIVGPCIPEIIREYFGITSLDFFADYVMKRNPADPSGGRCFEALAVTDIYLFLNETICNPKITYIEDFIAFLPKISEYFPEYSDKKLIPILSSLYIPPDVVTYLSFHKIYALGMRDDEDYMDLLNFKEVAMGMKDDGMDLLNFNEVQTLSIKY